jgi:Ca-activated chloride channel family protein
MSAGGAKDANSFRTNVQNGYLPQPTDVTSTGLFYDYYFDAREPRECGQLFCPTYSRAVSRDPLSNETEYYMTVGLNSNISREDLQRKKLNLVVVVDTSGSMSESFSKYYYDDSGTRHETERQPKMAAARQALHGLVDQLEADDRLGVVTFDDGARTLAPMTEMGERDTGALRSKIDGMRAGGGTDLSAGMDRARALAEPYADADKGEYETRVVYVTDAMANRGDTSTGPLKSRLQTDAESGIYSTFVGVGVDFNSQLVRDISQVEGGNYYSVNSGAQFRERLDEQFRYMVTPLVFDLTLQVESPGWDVETVYGAPGADEATGRVLHVDTLFPAPTTGNGSSKGGVVLVKLTRTSGSGNVRLTASYEDRMGRDHESVKQVTFARTEGPYYGSSAARKAVVLSRYSDLLTNWAAYERASLDGSAQPPAEGIETDPSVTTWEQGSVDLRVSQTYAARFRTFRRYMRTEMRALGDDDLRRELRLLDEVVNESVSARPAITTRDVRTGS